MRIGQPLPPGGTRVPPSGKAPRTPEPTHLDAGRRAASVGETVLGSGGALVGSIAGVYPGLLGGAVLGSLYGVGVGPLYGSLMSLGPTGFLTSSLHGMGLAVRAGLVLGGTCGLVGGAVLGWRGAGFLGKSLGFAAGALTSKAEPMPPGSARPRWYQEMPKAGYALTSAGLLTGAAGGFALGAGLGALSQAGALAGGLVGAVAFGAVGAVGGVEISKAVQRGYRDAKPRVLQGVHDGLEAWRESPHRRLITGAAVGATALGLMGWGTGMGLGTTVGCTLMGAGMGTAVAFVTGQPLR